MIRFPGLRDLVAVFLAVAGLLPVASSAVQGPVVYLTWQRDPTSTMVIRWLDSQSAGNAVEWRAKGSTNWMGLNSAPSVVLDTNWVIRSVELSNLAAASDHEFRIPPGTNVFKFRTMPADLSQPLRFVEGGDVYHSRKYLDPMNALAGKFDPAFGVLGGDLAYSHTNAVEMTWRWVDYFDSWMRNAVTPDGRLVPMLVSIGNHEVAGNWGQTPEKAKSFYRLFPLPGPPGYATLDFGKYLSLLLMDSGHTAPVPGAQTQWLEKKLRERRRVPHVFPIYHVTAYPSFRVDFTGASGAITRQIQTNWCPVFDKFHLPLAFEHHDHTFKRTQPMRGGKVDPRGTVYLGDGAWGVELRKPDPAKASGYLAKSASIRHFFVVTLYADARHILAVDETGRVFDELYQRVK